MAGLWFECNPKSRVPVNRITQLVHGPEPQCRKPLGMGTLGLQDRFVPLSSLHLFLPLGLSVDVPFPAPGLAPWGPQTLWSVALPGLSLILELRRTEKGRGWSCG